MTVLFGAVNDIRLLLVPAEARGGYREMMGDEPEGAAGGSSGEGASGSGLRGCRTWQSARAQALCPPLSRGRSLAPRER